VNDAHADIRNWFDYGEDASIKRSDWNIRSSRVFRCLLHISSSRNFFIPWSLHYGMYLYFLE